VSSSRSYSAHSLQAEYNNAQHHSGLTSGAGAAPVAGGVHTHNAHTSNAPTYQTDSAGRPLTKADEARRLQQEADLAVRRAEEAREAARVENKANEDAAREQVRLAQVRVARSPDHADHGQENLDAIKRQNKAAGHF